MYEDDYDRNDPRRLSYIASPLGESITTIPRTAAGAESSHSPITPSPISPEGHLKPPIGHRRPPLLTPRSPDRDSDSGSPDGTRSPTETATASFPLNDIDYESDPAAVAQELNNLAAIRRMSMDVAAAGDPDLPGYGGNFSVPSLPPTPSADENDASRLFWVPARLHPELAPTEFKSFLDSKADMIKRKSGDFSSLSPERQGSGSGLRRKKSMLSRQIDNSSGYTDGADRLERKRSQSSKRDGMLSPNLQELETLVDDSKASGRESPLLQGMQDVSITNDEDKPILPPAPPGHSLRRSTRTQYRKQGSLKKGEKPPYSKRLGKASERSDAIPSIATPEDQPILGLTRVSTDSSPKATRPVRAQSSPTRSTAYPPGTTTSSTFDAILDKPEAEEGESSGRQSNDTLHRSDSAGPRSVGSHARQWQSRLSSNSRSTLNIPPSEQKIPSIPETPTTEPSRASPNPPSQSGRPSERDAPAPKPVPVHDPSPSKRSLMNRAPSKESASSLNEFANSPQMIPGNSMRTDSLSFIPTVSEERKLEGKKSKDKKDSEGIRNSKWHFWSSNEDNKKKDKDSEAKRTKSKGHDNTRLDVLQSSLDTGPRGRESLVLDRLDPKLEEERRKDGARRASGESKKDKESGIFSSFFGGGKKKHSGEGHNRKSLSRTLSPDPPMRELRADIDYPWTRFSILEERAIYRMAHIKLANPRRALYSQVLLSNFMYSYLAKVQQMHPQMMVASQKQSKSPEEEYLQYQRYQVSGASTQSGHDPKY